MKEFDYIIIGGGCAGLSLAYELEIHEQLIDKNDDHIEHDHLLINEELNLDERI